MVFIDEEGKFNEYSYLIDAEFLKLEKTCALYVIESEGENMLIDTGEKLTARKLIKKLKAFDLFPIDKLFLTHAHWDHIQALPKIQKLHRDHDFEVFASEKALDVLKDPKEMNEFFGYYVDPIENVTPLCEGDILEVGDLELKIHNFFGHTMDSIALENPETKNLFVGDAIIDHIEPETYIPVLFGPHFNENALLNTYDKLREMRNSLNSISLAHFGVWKEEHCEKIIDEAEDLYLKAKNSLIEWYNNGLSVNDITKKYHDKLIPDSKIFSEESLMGLRWNIEQNLDTLRSANFIK
ncbi:MAG: MBL fold metallo-hydrolase [Promethearchaeia archaeon]